MLAIVWANEFGTGNDNPSFDDEYLDNEVVARQIVNRAIDDWNAVINDFNYDGNDDGVITGADYWIWRDNLGLSLDLENVAV